MRKDLSASFPICEVNVSFRDLIISWPELYATLGYAGTEPDDEALSLIRQLLDETKAVCRPRFGYSIVEGEVNDMRLRLSDIWFKPEGIITHRLKGCDSFAIILATVGAELDRWIQDYRIGEDVMKAFIADVIGSLAAEAVVEYGKRFLKEMLAQEGLKTTNSYSPGYCGWLVSEQRMLFSLLPAGFCGVTLTESCLMLPLKSVSSVVGIGPHVEDQPYSCAICRKIDCYRRKNDTR